MWAASTCRPAALVRWGRGVAQAARAPLSAVRPVPLKLITVTKGNGPAFDAAAAEYTDRLKRYTGYEEVVVKPNPKGVSDPLLQCAAEAERVLKHVGPRDRLVLLDERGVDISSEGLAALLATAGEDNVSALVFAIGGADGHSPAVKARARRSIAFGPQTWPHALARVMLAEQIYRAVSILAGSPYHREGPV